MLSSLTCDSVREAFADSLKKIDHFPKKILVEKEEIALALKPFAEAFDFEIQCVTGLCVFNEVKTSMYKYFSEKE